jgi:tetratricopeptide (TPR) repeat protein
MAFGFGFNKAKVLAAAVKYVQQGKLQAAIAEYEKVTKEDPKDLTVLNTIGDLYAQVGNTEQAAKYFQRVGDHYANDGFTVKAIAMYKKLTKLAAGNVEILQRLAELYTIQGLYNDARQQYVQIADFHLKNGNNDDAAKAFQKILELDPDNTAMQAKLADLYIKLGKKTEARNIYFTAAQSLYAKQAMDAADEALGKVLTLDPKNVDALLLRGAIAAESGNGAAAIECLKDVPDLDSRPEALRALLRAHLQQKNLEESAPLARKLLAVHNDLSGIFWYADALLEGGRFADAIQVYAEHADKVLATSGPQLVKTLSGVIAKAKESAPALEGLRSLFQKAGDTTHDAEIMELLAHAYVSGGRLAEAKDLYQQLAKSEPENPLHMQNYKQVVSMLGEDAASGPLSAEQAEQALMVEEVEHEPAPALKQEYTPEQAAAVRQALTDSELFDSYNLPAKAIPPLEKGLAQAPQDLQINRRLASLYVKVNRYADASRCFETLKQIYAQAGHEAEAQKYGEMAARYLTMTAADKAEAVAETEPAVSMLTFEQEAAAAAPSVEAFAASSVGEISFESVAEESPAAEESAAVSMEAPAPPAATAASEAHEITLDTSEWESMMVDEAPAAAAAPPAEPEGFSMEVVPLDAGEPAQEAPAPEAVVSEFVFESTSEAAPVEIEPEAPAPPPVEAAPPPPPPPPKPVEAPPVKAAPAPPPPTPPRPEPVMAAKADDLDLLGDLASDLEESLGEDFTFGGKPAATPPPPPPAPPAIAAAASLPVVAPVAKETVPEGFSSMSHEVPQDAPVIEHHEAANVLSDLFDEFKEDAEATATEVEDPDTHYNLGIAFKEMGLLDEAIGELQKVCHAVEKGHPFTQAMQAYTWLAQCLVDKGVPQAAVRWYEKALQLKGIEEESRLAVYYDLASAYEMAGNQKKAYETFMEVYSSNIDYRDVADRLKSLKA